MGAPGDKTTAARLANAALHAKVRSALPQGLQRSDADDVVQKVFIKLLLMATLPATDDGLLGLAVVVTRRTAIDHFRGAQRRKRKEEEIDPLAELLAQPEPEVTPDVQRMLEEAVAQGKVPRSVLLTASMLADGKSFAEIASATGRTLAAIKMEWSRAKKHVRENAGAYAALTGVVAVFLFVFIVRPHLPKSDRDIITADTSTASPTAPAPAASTLPYGVAIRTDAGPMLQAMDLTRRAEFECGAGDWDACERTLDEAAQLEPPLDPARELRQRIDTARRYPDGGAPPLKPPAK